jgi:glycosyl transferase, family 25
MLEHFDLVLIINLAHRKDRWQEISEQFAKIGRPIDLQRIQRFDAVRPDSEGGFPSLGAKGCYMSHLGALKHALNAGAESVLIIEDDLDFVHDFVTRWSDISRELAHQPWDFFYGAGRFSTDDVTRVSDDLAQLPSDKLLVTAAFVGMKRTAMHASVAFLEEALTRAPGSPEGGPMHVDGAYCWVRELNPSLVTLVASPVLGDQRASRTDIHALAWYDRAPLIRDLTQWLRRTMRAASADRSAR